MNVPIEDELIGGAFKKNYKIGGKVWCEQRAAERRLEKEFWRKGIQIGFCMELSGTSQQEIEV